MNAMTETVMQQRANQAEIQQAIQDANQAVREAGNAARNAARDAARADQAARTSSDQPPPARASDNNATIVIPSDRGDDIHISVDGGGIHVRQGDHNTTIPVQDVVPRGAVQMTYAISAALIAIAIVGPIVRFFVRRYERRSFSAKVSADVQARLDAMERNIDTVALEMERVSEGQRFTNKLLEQRPVEHAQRIDR